MELTTASLPILSPHAIVSSTENAVLVDTPSGGACYRGRTAPAVLALTGALSGKNSIEELAKQRGWTADALLELLAPMLAVGGIADIGPVIEATDAESQLTEYYSLCDAWALDIFTRPFWRIVVSGGAPQNVVLGWCIEFYHRTVGADEHNALSVEHCSDPEVRSWLKKHFEEEFGHGELFLDGLEKCGFLRAAIAQSTPLPTTRQLIDYMGELARTDIIAYLGCYGVLHSPRVGQTLERARDQFEQFALLYPFARPAIDKIKRHAEIDLIGGHDQIILEQFVRQRGRLDSDMAYQVVRAAHGMVAVFCRFFDGIFDHYEQFGIEDRLRGRAICCG